MDIQILVLLVSVFLATFVFLYEVLELLPEAWEDAAIASITIASAIVIGFTYFEGLESFI